MDGKRRWALVAASALAASVVAAAAGPAWAAAPRHAPRGPVRPGAGRVAAGRVVGVQGQAVLVSLPDGRLVALNVPARLHVFEGLEPSNLGAVQAGDYVLARYRVTREGLVATRLAFAPEPLAAGRPRWVVGRVSAVASNALTLTLSDGKSLVLAPVPGARYRVEGSPGTASAVVVGDFVRALVRGGRSGTDAWVVVAAPVPRWLHPVSVAGTVAAVGPGSLTVRTEQGTSYALTVEGAVPVRVDGHAGTLQDVQPGDQVTVVAVRFGQSWYALQVRAGSAAAPTASGGAGA